MSRMPAAKLHSADVVEKCIRPNDLFRTSDRASFKVDTEKTLANGKRPCGCSVLCLRPKSSLCSCPHSFIHWWILPVNRTRRD